MAIEDNDEKDTPTPRLRRLPKNEPVVNVVVTKFGHGKVSTGEHVAIDGDVMAERGETLAVSLSTAKALEEKGYAELVDAAPAAKAAKEK